VAARPDKRRRLMLIGAGTTAAVVIAAIAIWAATSTRSSKGTVIASGTATTTFSTSTGNSEATVPAAGIGPGSSAVVTPAPTQPGSTASAPPPSATTTAPAPATTTTHPAASGTTTVTEADSGRSYQLHRGDRLVVNLAGPAIYTWTEPASSNGAVLSRTSGSPGASAGAVFVAAAGGQAVVSATATPNCYPRCLPPTRLFQVNVSVAG
jgi:hypothetical protein